MTALAPCSTKQGRRRMVMKRTGNQVKKSWIDTTTTFDHQILQLFPYAPSKHTEHKNWS